MRIHFWRWMHIWWLGLLWKRKPWLTSWLPYTGLFFLVLLPARQPTGVWLVSATFARGKNEAEDLSSGWESFGFFDGECEGGQLVVAQPIQADRIHFTGSPEFDLLPFFDQPTARAYASPLECSHDGCGVKPPKVSVHASRSERNKLFQKMADCNRLVPVDPCVVRRDLASGLFCGPQRSGEGSSYLGF